MRTNKLIGAAIFLSIIFLFSQTKVLADVAIPRAKSVQFQISQNFSDYNFYLCVVPYSSKYDKGYHYTYFYEELKLTPVEISVGKPLIIPSENYDKFMYFLAVKKTIGLENSELKNRVIDALTGKTKNSDISYFDIDTSEDYKHEDKNARNVIYTIEGIDGSGIKINRQYDDSFSFASGKLVYLAIGLGLTAVFIALGLIFIRKWKKN